MLKDDHESNNLEGLRFAFNSMVHKTYNYIASCMCSFLGSGLEFSLSLISTKVTLLEPEITSLLVGIRGLQFLGQRLEDGLRGAGDWELHDSRSNGLLNLFQSGGRLG